MSPLFADTGYWIALFYKSDQLHSIARLLAQRHHMRLIVTSEMILTEFLNASGGQGSRIRNGAVEFVRGLQMQSNLRIIPQTPELFSAAIELYQQRPDKEWSLTDCASFVICQQESIHEALAHDHHFSQAGLIAILREVL